MQNRGGIGNRDNSVSKPILLGLTTAIIIGVLTPLVIPHISHPSMIYHTILHLAGLTIASFLGLVSYLAYKRVGGSRILLMTVGFMALSTAEILYFLDAMDIFPMVHLPIANMELSHAILLVMITLFGLGVLKNSEAGEGHNVKTAGTFEIKSLDERKSMLMDHIANVPGIRYRELLKLSIF